MPEIDELKELLEKNIKVSEESLKILKKMNRARIMGGVFKILKWLIIVGISLGLYYYIEPYITGLLDTLNSITSTLGEIRGATEQLNPENAPPNLLEKLQGLFKK